MTSSISSSGSLELLGVFLALTVGACSHATPRPRSAPITRIALFPVEDFSGGRMPTEHLSSELARATAGAGMEVVTESAVESVLARHRIREYGVGLAAAEVARQELGVEAVLVVDVERYVSATEPTLALTARLVSVTGRPRVLWMDGYALSGERTRGILGLGGVHEMGEAERQAAAGMAASLRAYLADGSQEGGCSSRSTYAPRRAYHAPLPLGGRRVVILPFINRTPNADAGTVIALQLMRQFVANGKFDVDDPGAVQEGLRMLRVLTIGGVAPVEAQRMGVELDVDLVVSGEVLQFEEGGIPKVEFTILVLDRDGKLVWRSTSRNTGSDSVTVFEFGFLPTAGEVACRMSAAVVAGLASGD
jgi:hypothetical protein